jgi:rhodanese-related sulfurtransferase
MKTIERDELKVKLDGGAGVTLLEALPELYFKKGHLPGARLFPHDQVEALAPRLLQDKAASIVVYCASQTCPNSHLAAESLERLGYSDVRVYTGGKKDWESAGLPLER